MADFSTRKLFKFYRSYYEIAQELPEIDRLSFYDALIKVQFSGEETTLQGLAKFAYISQNHSINSQLEGFINFEKRSPPGTPPGTPPEGEDKDKEEVKEEVKEEEYKKPKKLIYDFKFELLKLNIDENLIDEWLLVRKNKRLTNTETAFKSFLREVEKTKKSINEILELCIVKSWGGFESKFLENLNKNQNGTNYNNSGTSTSEGYKPAKVNVEKLLRELADDVATGNIPGVY